MNPANNKSETENLELFHCLFKNIRELLHLLCPEGWEKSGLYLLMHPTPQQQYAEALRMHQNLNRLLNARGKGTESEAPKPEDFLPEDAANKINPLEEFVEIYGLCLWDIFSDNHEVVASDGKIHDIGSFRGAGRFIADYINMCLPEIELNYDYIDFYMGTIWIYDRADVTPIYEQIFSRLKAQNCDWLYHFPRMYLLDVTDLKESPKVKPEENFLEYDPGESLAEELEQIKHKEEVNKLREELDDAYEEAVEEACCQPLPRTVQAYKNIFRHLPEGWPHR